MARTSALAWSKRAASRGWVAKVLTKSAPLMLSVSLTMLLISALCSMALRRMSRRMRPTRRAGNMKSGTTNTDMIANRHSMLTMMTTVETRVTMLVRMLGRVPVMAFCAPTTSLLKREMISPDLVWVKKRMPIRWRWAYIWPRRS